MEKVESAQTVATPPGVAVEVGGVQEKLMKKIEPKNRKWIYPLIAVVVILAGVGTGSMLSGTGNASMGTVTSEKGTTGSDVDTASLTEGEGQEGMDTLEKEGPIGVLREGGSESGEGTHRLERGLGPEKDVYILSTVLTLDNFVGKKVQVWGQDLGAKKVGWLMDVIRVKVLE